jgi:predicted DNA-binding transcriptional regulator AlpA
MQPNQDKMDQCVGEQQVAAITDLSVQTLRKWRVQGRGPQYLKLGGRVTYRLRDIESWLTASAK